MSNAKTNAQADSSTVTIHDYSIRVTRLPQDASADELVEFFSQYGEVGRALRTACFGPGALIRMGSGPGMVWGDSSAFQCLK